MFLEESHSCPRSENTNESTMAQVSEHRQPDEREGESLQFDIITHNSLRTEYKNETISVQRVLIAFHL